MKRYNRFVSRDYVESAEKLAETLEQEIKTLVVDESDVLLKRQDLIQQREAIKQQLRYFTERSDDELADFKKTLLKNRFWLDDESYQILNEYVSVASSRDFVWGETIEEVKKGLKEQEAKLEELRENVLVVRERILSQ